jgi:hypothetical protein
VPLDRLAIYSGRPIDIIDSLGSAGVDESRGGRVDGAGEGRSQSPTRLHREQAKSQVGI